MADGMEAIGARRHFQYIVVGCGGVGSGAVYWLSKRAPGEVLGLEQFEIGHVRGGSQDVSRIIRLTYHEDFYTRLTPATFECWSQVEKESGLQLVFKSGGLQLFEPGANHLLKKYEDAMKRFKFPYERWNPAQLREHYPQFTPNPDVTTLYQKDAGLVDAALGITTHLQLARGNGAVIIDNCPVQRIRRAPSGLVEVVTTKGTFTCSRLVVAAGAWLNDVLGSIGVHVPVHVSQEQVSYFATPHIKEFTKDRFPMWFYHKADVDFYALPIYSNSGTKIGIDAGGPIVTGNTRNFTVDPVRLKTCVDLLKQVIPKYLGPEMLTKTCLYTMTPDRNFVIDNCARKGFSDVIVCCGAGHAYKFASLLGKILSEMAVDGGTQYNISEFTMDRPAISDPSYVPQFQFGVSELNPNSKL